MSYLVVAGAAIIVGLLAGTPLASLLPVLLLLACPLMMAVMMRGMHVGDHAPAEPRDEPTQPMLGRHH